MKFFDTFTDNKVIFTPEDQVGVRRLLHSLGYDLLEPIHNQFVNRLKEKGVSLDPLKKKILIKLSFNKKRPTKSY